MIFLTVLFIILLIVALLVVIIHEIILLVGYGICKDEYIVESINKNGFNDINRYNNIFLNNYRIRKFDYKILCKYYIEDIGIIYRWYKSDKLIDKKFEELKKKKLGI